MSLSGEILQNYLIPLEEINRATENFSQQRFIGGGGFGAVYKGELSERWQNRTAAIKRLSRDSHQGEHEFFNELEMISRFHHQNIIAFLGYCDEGDEMIIVYEYAINGSLDQHLEDPNRMRCLTWTKRLMICIGAARGLNYLHSGLGEHNRVIHRDVKSANILLDDNFIAKISDFGLSKLGPRNQPNTELYTKVAGTQFYLDPTYHESRILRKESDVYSFGVVLFEILSGMLVYQEMRSKDDGCQFLMTSVRKYYNRKEPHKVIDPHIRDQIHSTSFEAFQEIAYQCISYNLTERPTLDTVINKIEEALNIQTSLLSTSTAAKRPKIEHLLSRLSSGNPYDQRIAAGEIRLLSKVNPDNSIIFAKAGAIPLLTDLLKAADPQTQEHALTALLNLSISEHNKRSIVSLGALLDIVHLLIEGSMESRENAAAILFSLNIDENKVAIDAVGAIPPLVLLLSEGTLIGKKNAATALLNLCIYQGNKVTALRAGVIPILTELLRKPRGGIEDDLMAILGILSNHPEGNLAIGKAEVVPLLVEVMGSGSSNSKENAAAVLVELCSIDQRYLEKAQEQGVMGKLIDLLHNGTDRGKRKAGQLLEKIRDHSLVTTTN